jgi:hypothetical protein
LLNKGRFGPRAATARTTVALYEAVDDLALDMKTLHCLVVDAPGEQMHFTKAATSSRRLVLQTQT